MAANYGKYLGTCAATALLAVALSACGGGGGSSGSGPVTGEGDMPDGGTPETSVQDIIDGANTQIMATSGPGVAPVYADITCGPPGSGPAHAPTLSCTLNFGQGITIPYVSPELLLGTIDHNPDVRDLQVPTPVNTNGVELRVLDFAGTVEVLASEYSGFGRYLFGILEHSAFMTGTSSGSGELVASGIIAPEVYQAGVLGNAPNSNPTVSAIWEGVFAGFWTGQGGYQGNTIVGESTVGINGLGGSNPTVNLSLDDLVDMVDRRHSVASVDVNRMRLRAGAFEDRTGRVRGTFYGPQHEEVAGTFTRNSLAGAFGASRE